MNYFVYILYSKQIDQYYVGHTQDIEKRLSQHNSARSKSTKKTSDWELVYQERFTTRGEAMRREQTIKKKKSRLYIESLLQG
jgi:putative endonuclease